MSVQSVCVCVGGVKGFCVRIIRFNLSRGGINEDNATMSNPLNQLLPSATFMSSTGTPVSPSEESRLDQFAGVLMLTPRF